MGLIIKEYTVTGDKGSATVTALLDTGAVASFMRKDVAEGIVTLVTTIPPQRFAMADGKGTLTIDQVATVTVTIGDANLMFAFLAVEELAEEMIIGADMMQRWKIRLDPAEVEVSIDPLALRLRI